MTRARQVRIHYPDIASVDGGPRREGAIKGVLALLRKHQMSRILSKPCPGPPSRTSASAYPFSVIITPFLDREIHNCLLISYCTTL